MLSKWQLSRKYFSLIWLHTICESKENKNSFYILDFLMELTFKIWQFENFFPQNLANLGHFLHDKKPVYRLKSYFSG